MVKGKGAKPPTKTPKAVKPNKTGLNGVPGTTPAAEPPKVVDLPTKTSVAAKPGTPGTNALTPDQKRALALRHAEKLKDHKAKVASANGALRSFLKEAKSDGFKKSQLEDILLAQTPEGEATLKERLELTLTAAKWAGKPFGDLLDHLDKPDLTPAVDRAYDEGKMASMENQAARPGYHASTPQYAAYMKGFHDHQATLVADGIKPISEAPGEDEADPTDDNPIDDSDDAFGVDPDSSISGEAVFRSEYEKRKDATS